MSAPAASAALIAVGLVAARASRAGRRLIVRPWHWAAAVAGGLVIDRHVLYVFALGLLLGALVVYSSRTLRSVGRAGPCAGLPSLPLRSSANR